MKKSALNMLGVSSPMNQNNKKGEIKTWNEGEPNITGSSGLLGVIGGGGLKVLSKLWKTFANAPKQYKNIGRPYASTITKPAKDLAVAPKVSKPTITNTFSDRQHAYLQQQMKQREVGSASWRLQRTHKKAVSDFYAGKGPKKPPHKYKDGKSFWTSFFPGGY
tara:strand:+ start:129 stop:617 length:489 start_codon:yes stop_codon:yes gene_type:complete